MALEIAGVHHVALQVRDLDAACTFYRDVLGLTEADRPDFGIDGAWFTLGSNQVHLVAEEGYEGPPSQHFAIQVADLDAAVEAIEAKGVEVSSIGLAFPGAGHQAFLRDPSGNLIELNQPE